jgi:hypothetical protein
MNEIFIELIILLLAFREAVRESAAIVRIAGRLFVRRGQSRQSRPRDTGRRVRVRSIRVIVEWSERYVWD